MRGGEAGDGEDVEGSEAVAEAPEEAVRAWSRVGEKGGVRAAVARNDEVAMAADVGRAVVVDGVKAAREDARRTRSRHRTQSRERSRAATEATEGRMIVVRTGQKLEL